MAYRGSGAARCFSKLAWCRMERKTNDSSTFRARLLYKTKGLLGRMKLRGLVLEGSSGLLIESFWAAEAWSSGLLLCLCCCSQVPRSQNALRARSLQVADKQAAEPAGKGSGSTV